MNRVYMAVANASAIFAAVKICWSCCRSAITTLLLQPDRSAIVPAPRVNETPPNSKSRRRIEPALSLEGKVAHNGNTLLWVRIYDANQFW